MTPTLTELSTWLRPEAIQLDVPLRDVRHALASIADVVAAGHGLDADVVFRALSRREQAGSTALGGGFAVPHARIAGIARPITVLLRAAEAIDFDAPDREPVRLLLAILVPERGDRQAHLDLLARVAELFCDADFRHHLDTAPDAARIAQAFAGAASRLARGARAQPR